MTGVLTSSWRVNVAIPIDKQLSDSQSKQIRDSFLLLPLNFFFGGI